MSEQDTLVAGSVNTESIAGTVYVVTARKDGDPHSHVEAVYDNKDAARKHKSKLGHPVRPPNAIAWGVHEIELSSNCVVDE